MVVNRILLMNIIHKPKRAAGTEESNNTISINQSEATALWRSTNVLLLLLLLSIIYLPETVVDSHKIRSSVKVTSNNELGQGRPTVSKLIHAWS